MRTKYLNAQGFKQIKRFFSSTKITDNNWVLTGKPNDHYDIIIVGGGVVGSALANVLSSIPSTSKLSIGVINPVSPLPLFDYERDKKYNKKTYENSEKNCNGHLPNARSYALSPASLEVLGVDNIKKLQELHRVAYYNRMQIWESNGPATLHFSYKDLPAKYKTKILGAVIEDGPLVSSLWDSIQTRQQQNSPDDESRVHFLCPGILEKIHNLSDEQNESAPLSLEYQNKVTKETHTISTNLLVGADGLNSSVRKLFGISTFQSDYGRRAVTCTVKMADVLNNTAFQRFFPTGPIALLPIWSHDKDSDEPIYANIVWSTTPDHATYLKNLSTSEFLKELNSSLQVGPTQSPHLLQPSLTSKFPSPIGKAVNGFESLFQSMNKGLTVSHWAEDPSHSFFSIPPQIIDVVGPRLSFDLKLSQATQYVSRTNSSRAVLVGDAAHALHPMAGQGLNLGLGDVNTLALEIQKAVESGMDVGSSGSLFLKRYESQRQLASSVVMGGVQFLHSSFGWESGIGINMRSLGMNMIGTSGMVRKKLAEVAAFGGGIL